MIGIVSVEVQCQNPNMPLYPMRAFVSSPTSIRVRNVPKRIGKWAIESVQFVAAYPDGSIKTAQCVLTGGVWVGTIEGTSTSGTSTNGYTIFASGTDENGNAVTGYILGKGDIEILNADGTLNPDAPSFYVHYFDTAPEQPHVGDSTFIDGTYCVWTGTEWKQSSAPYTTPSYIEDANGNKIEADRTVEIAQQSNSHWTITDGTNTYALTGSKTNAIWNDDSIKYNILSVDDFWALSYHIKIGSLWVISWQERVEGSEADTNLTFPSHSFNATWEVPITQDVLALKSELPTKVSDLTNDSGFVTSSEMDTSLELKQDKLSEAQMDAINKDANAYYTSFYVQGESQEYLFIAPSTLTKSDFAALGVYDTTTGTWTKNLTSIRTGTNVTSLESSLFKDVTTLTYLEGPELKFTSGGGQSLSGCTGLRTLILPKVVLIPINFCKGCTTLSNLTIPASLTNIGGNAFLNCSNLQIRFQEKTVDEVKAMANYPWGLNASQIKVDRLSDNQIFTIDQSMDEALTEIRYQRLSSILTIKGFTEGSDLTLQDFANAGLYNMTTGNWTYPIVSVKTGSNVTNLDTRLFKGVTSLTTFDGSKVEIVGNEVFSGCTGLNQVSLPSVKILSVSSFYGCTSLTSLNIPTSITAIRLNAFNGCTNLTVNFQEKTIAEVQAMLNYPWGLATSNITVSNNATQEWVAQNYVTQTYAVKNDGGVAKVMSLTERQYERLEDKDPTTLYVIPEEV